MWLKRHIFLIKDHFDNRTNFYLSKSGLVWYSDIYCSFIFRILVPKLYVSPPDTETLRIFIILPLFSLFDDPKFFSELHSPVSRNRISLTKPAWNVIEKWISLQTAEYLRPYVNNFKVCCSLSNIFCFQRSGIIIWVIFALSKCSRQSVISPSVTGNIQLLHF